MLLSVDHVTRYRYDRPVRGVVQSHRLVPSSFDGQKVRDWTVTVTDGVAGGAFRDGAGDRVQGWTVPGPVSEIEVRVTGTVETVDLAGVLRGHRELVPAEVYLCETLATQADAALVLIDLQRDFMEPGGFGETLGNDVSLLAAIVPATQTLLAAWRELYPQVARTFQATDPKRRLKWAGPDMSARSSISARLMASICCSPPDSVPACWLRRSPSRGKRE